MGFGNFAKNLAKWGWSSLRNIGKQVGHEMADHPAAGTLNKFKAAARRAGDEIEGKGLRGYVADHAKNPTTSFGKKFVNFAKTKAGGRIIGGTVAGTIGYATADKDSTPGQRWARAGAFAAGGVYLAGRFQNPAARAALKKGLKSLGEGVTGTWIERNENKVARYYTDESGQRWLKSHERLGELDPAATYDWVVEGDPAKGEYTRRKVDLDKYTTPGVKPEDVPSVAKIEKKKVDLRAGRGEKFKAAAEGLGDFLGIKRGKPLEELGAWGRFGRKLRNYGIAAGIGAAYGVTDPHTSIVEGAMGGMAVYGGYRILRKNIPKVYKEMNKLAEFKALESEYTTAKEALAVLNEGPAVDVKMGKGLYDRMNKAEFRAYDFAMANDYEYGDWLHRSSVFSRKGGMFETVGKGLKGRNVLGKQPLVRIGAGLGLISAGLLGAEGDPSGFGLDREGMGMLGQIMKRTAKGAGLGFAAKIALKHPMLAMGLGMSGMRLEGARRQGYQSYIEGGRVGVAPLEADGDLALSLHTVRHGY